MRGQKMGSFQGQVETIDCGLVRQSLQRPEDDRNSGASA